MKNFLPDITQIPIRSPFLKRKKSCPLSGENAPKIDYKNTISIEILELSSKLSNIITFSLRDLISN